ncbi:AMIN domain-containing protein [uncultured Helicobacter sp.]|uniref:AMIN domain-containing protein n=1 Tax=uncultured Helicobacter sp. TaxID=175537 RepID=UPI00374F3E3B
MRLIILLFMCCATLIAREDPFEPSIAPKEGLHSQKDPKREILQSIDIALPSTARVLQKVSITYQNIDGTIATKEININQGIDWHYPLELAQKAIGKSYDGEKRLNIGEFELYFDKNKVFIATQYTNVRHFILPNPYRIVLDFEGMDKAINQTELLQKKYVRKVVFSSHESFYRISLELDGQYAYDLVTQRDGYMLEFK